MYGVMVIYIGYTCKVVVISGGYIWITKCELILMHSLLYTGIKITIVYSILQLRV